MRERTHHCMKPMLPCFAILLWVLVVADTASSSAATDTKLASRLKVSSNHRFLVTTDDRPFFWLGDTAWELFHRLDRTEAELYLADRAAKGFTVIQAVALAELDGLKVPNQQGHLPLLAEGYLVPEVKEGPDNDYWDDVEWTIRLAGQKGLYVGLLPLWAKYRPADTGTCERYGRFIGERFKNQSNIIWNLGAEHADDLNGGHVKSFPHAGIGWMWGQKGRRARAPATGSSDIQCRGKNS